MQKYIKTPDIIRIAARELRNNMTISEKKLWNILRRDIFGYRFLRQKPIYVYTEDNGHDRFIIADFYCDEKKIVIEVDGNIHNNKNTYLLDREKEKLLKKQNIQVLRILNEDIENNIDGVIQEIKNKFS